MPMRASSASRISCFVLPLTANRNGKAELRRDSRVQLAAAAQTPPDVRRSSPAPCCSAVERRSCARASRDRDARAAAPAARARWRPRRSAVIARAARRAIANGRRSHARSATQGESSKTQPSARDERRAIVRVEIRRASSLVTRPTPSTRTSRTLSAPAKREERRERLLRRPTRAAAPPRATLPAGGRR